LAPPSSLLFPHLRIYERKRGGFFFSHTESLYHRFLRSPVLLTKRCRDWVLLVTSSLDIASVRPLSGAYTHSERELSVLLGTLLATIPSTKNISLGTTWSVPIERDLYRARLCFTFLSVDSAVKLAMYFAFPRNMAPLQPSRRSSRLTPRILNERMSLLLLVSPEVPCFFRFLNPKSVLTMDRRSFRFRRSGFINPKSRSAPLSAMRGNFSIPPFDGGTQIPPRVRMLSKPPLQSSRSPPLF